MASGPAWQPRAGDWFSNGAARNSARVLATSGPCLGDAPTARQTFIFSRQYRLLSPKDFRRVFDQAQRSRDKYFTVLWRSNDLQTARIGFAIAKKRIASAVRRNRVRRVARESFRLNRSKLGKADIVIMAQSAAQKASNAELNAALSRHWQRIQGAATERQGQADMNPNDSVDKR